MASKRTLHHFQTKLRSFKLVYLFIALGISLAISLYALRQNNLHAIHLRDEVLKADKANKNVEEALKKLRVYIYGHMNTDLASTNSIKQPIQLKYSYDRAVAAEKNRVSKINENIYRQAQTTCEQLFPIGLSGSGRIPCIKDYVAKNGATEQPIQDTLYKYNFVSPLWSPDVAGFALLVSGVLFLLIIARLSIDYWLKKQLSDHL